MTFKNRGDRPGATESSYPLEAHLTYSWQVRGQPSHCVELNSNSLSNLEAFFSTNRKEHTLLMFKSCET